MTKHLLRQCLVDSLNSLPNHPQRKHYVHISFAVVAGTVLAMGFNKSDTPPVHFGYNNRVPEPKTHSELDAYRRLRKRVAIAKCNWSLVNVRINRSGEMKLAKPCHVCQEWLTAVGCSEVVYTTGAGWEKLKLT